MTNAQHTRNLLKVFDMETSSFHRHQALESYWRYHRLITALAMELQFSLKVAAGVFAALSPNNSYLGNLGDTRKLLTARRIWEGIESFKVHTYQQNKIKAWSIACGEDPEIIIRGNKTRAFYHNCLDPNDAKWITVDGHLYWAWMGRKGVIKSRAKNRKDVAPSIGDELYAEISDCVRLVAEIRQMPVPNQVQAVIWQNWRIMHGVQGSNQMELIASDCFAIGQPDHPLAKSGCSR